MADGVKLDGKSHEVTCEADRMYCRYVSEQEWKKLCSIKSGDRSYQFDGQKEWVYFTDEKFDTVEKARKKLALTYDPHYMIPFQFTKEEVLQAKKVHKIYYNLYEPISTTTSGAGIEDNAVKQPGGGNEFMGKPPLNVMIDTKEVQTLTYASYDDSAFLVELKRALEKEDCEYAKEVMKRIADVNKELNVKHDGQGTKADEVKIKETDFWKLNYRNYIKANLQNNTAIKVSKFVEEHFSKEVYDEDDIYEIAGKLWVVIKVIYHKGGK